VWTVVLGLDSAAYGLGGLGLHGFGSVEFHVVVHREHGVDIGEELVRDEVVVLHDLCMLAHEVGLVRDESHLADDFQVGLAVDECESLERGGTGTDGEFVEGDREVTRGVVDDEGPRLVGLDGLHESAGEDDLGESGSTFLTMTDFTLSTPSFAELAWLSLRAEMRKGKYTPWFPCFCSGFVLESFENPPCISPA